MNCEVDSYVRDWLSDSFESYRVIEVESMVLSFHMAVIRDFLSEGVAVDAVAFVSAAEVFCLDIIVNIVHPSLNNR